ncbi:hypothetical protein GCM10022247_04690 [Allokutzneria multivorans]|uniref:Uncharacterized protein n=1 Tax=Allokutzneria multivorans TaxID=1142134 RepID=A0ABP7QYD5_9PSEU
MNWDRNRLRSQWSCAQSDASGVSLHQQLADAIRCELTGVECDELIEEPLPNGKWLRFTGKAHREDLGLDENCMVVVSERALKLLREHGLKYADVLAAIG